MNVSKLKNCRICGSNKFSKVINLGKQNIQGSFIKKNFPFCIGAACYPEGHVECKDLDKDIENLKRKVDSGVDFLVTQLFFDNRYYYEFLDRELSG